jgi:hypothetical protein
MVGEEISSPMTVALYGGEFQPLGQVARYTSCEVDWVNLDAGTGTLVVGETSLFAQTLLSVQTAPVLVVVTINGVRWVGRVAISALDRNGKPGTGTITATLVSEFIWLKYMMASQNGADPSLTSMPAYDVQTGPIATLVAYYINAAAKRLGAPVVAVAPDSDTSAIVTLQGRYPTTLADLLVPVMASEGIVLDVDVWFERSKIPTGQPQPAHLPVIVFQPRQVTTGVPGLRWSDTVAQLSKLHLELTGATGYEALVDLGGDGVAAVYDRVIDDPPEGTGGAYALPEVVVSASNTTLGPDSQARGREGLVDHRGKSSLSFEVQDGSPWRFGEDYLAGDAAVVEIAGIPFIDQITKINAKRDPASGLVITPTLGDLTVDENMTQLTVRAIGSIQSQLRLLQAGR